MKILQIIPYFYPALAYGGNVISCYETCKQLAKKHDVTVFTTNIMNANNKIKKKEDNINNIKIKYFNNLSAWLSWNHRIFISPELRGAIKNNIKNYDIVHLNTYRGLETIFAWKCAKKYKIPYVTSPRGSILRIMKKQKLKYLYDILWGYNILKDSKKIIAQSLVEAKQCETMNVKKGKIEIIPNGIDLSEFKKLPKRKNFRKKYSIDNDEKIILFLGRINKIKGLDILVKAFANLEKEVNNIRLVIIGPDDGYLNDLKNQINLLNISDKILLTGSLFGKEKLEAYVDADIYVLPSIYENFPNSVLEACAIGLPIVMTNACGLTNVINNKAGYAVPYDDSQLQSTIKRLLINDKIRKKFGKAGKKIAKKFTWERSGKLLENIYKNILGF